MASKNLFMLDVTGAPAVGEEVDGVEGVEPTLTHAHLSLGSGRPRVNQ